MYQINEGRVAIPQTAKNLLALSTPSSRTQSVFGVPLQLNGLPLGPHTWSANLTDGQVFPQASNEQESSYSGLCEIDFDAEPSMPSTGMRFQDYRHHMGGSNGYEDKFLSTDSFVNYHQSSYATTAPNAGPSVPSILTTHSQELQHPIQESNCDYDYGYVTSGILGHYDQNPDAVTVRYAEFSASSIPAMHPQELQHPTEEAKYGYDHVLDHYGQNPATTTIHDAESSISSITALHSQDSQYPIQKANYGYDNEFLSSNFVGSYDQNFNAATFHDAESSALSIPAINTQEAQHPIQGACFDYDCQLLPSSFVDNYGQVHYASIVREGNPSSHQTPNDAAPNPSSLVQPAQYGNTRTACEYCRKNKRRCTKHSPCTECAKRNLTCLRL